MQYPHYEGPRPLFNEFDRSMVIGLLCVTINCCFFLSMLAIVLTFKYMSMEWAGLALLSGLVMFLQSIALLRLYDVQQYMEDADIYEGD